MKIYCEKKSTAKFITIETNIYIPLNQEYEFKFYLMNKKR